MAYEAHAETQILAPHTNITEPCVGAHSLVPS